MNLEFLQNSLLMNLKELAILLLLISILKEELLRVLGDYAVILSSISLIMTHNLNIMKPENPCQVLIIQCVSLKGCK